MTGNLQKNWWAVLLSLFLTNECFCQNTYYWNGADGASWTVASNWSPERVTPQAGDILTFDADSPNEITVIDVPTQTVGSVIITEGAPEEIRTVHLRSAGARYLTVTGTFQVDKDCAVTISESGGNVINVVIADGASASIGGTVTMNRGTFGMAGSSTMILGGVSPLNRVDGQFSLSETCTLYFGRAQDGAGEQIRLPDNIFAGSPTISRIIVNNAEGAALGNQTITVKDGVDLIYGTLITNALGRIKLSATATPPTEKETSNIDGYVELSKTVGTGALSFMGLEIDAGPDNLGNVTVMRRTGPDNVVNFNGYRSIASIWNVSADNQPVSGRTLSFSWTSALDNGSDPSLKFQVYRYDNGPDWEPIGPLRHLSENASGIRKTVAVTTDHFSEWTVADEFNPLPVTWLDFYGLRSGHSIELTWKTATEENTDFFSIEKMVNDETFVPIGQVSAVGNSSTVKSYRFTDGEPVYGLNYYRIRQVDLDGRYDYSKIISVLFESDARDLYTVFPVPAGRKLTVRRNFVFTENERITLLDSFGRAVFSKAWNTAENVTFDDLTLPAGMYRLVIISGSRRHDQAVIITN